MEVQLAYGRDGLVVSVPDHADVILPRHQSGIADERAAFAKVVREPIGTRPLKELAGAEDQVVIVISDMTRPTPNERLVPWILEELSHVPRSNFLILVGTGTHRPNTPEELERMLGREVVQSVRVLNHNGYDSDELRFVGNSALGHPVSLNRHYLDADVKIVVGFIEPHFFAGFSGGPKGVCPGVAAVQTIQQLHSSPLIQDPRATWGVLDGNPVHEGVTAAVRLAPPDFMVNVTLNQEREITGVYAGDWFTAHRTGCRDCAEAAMVPVDDYYDIVLTTNSGFPLDQNLYQTVKGMSAAARIVRPGGAIIIASECCDGLPNHGRYGEMLQMRETTDELLAMIEAPGFSMLDQWQVQIQAQVQRLAQVYLVSTLPEESVRLSKLHPVDSVETALQLALERQGDGARIAVLPMGPLTAPYVAQRVG